MAPSTVAATEAAIENIHRHNETLNAVVTWDEEAALARAAEADRAADEGRWLGILHGMTMTLKDNIATAGMRTTSGAMFFAEHVPNEDADVVRRMRAAGAVLIG